MTSPDQFGLSLETISKIHSVFRNFPAIQESIIYGSRAKGNFRPGSDIDLTFKGEGLDVGVILRLDTALDDLLLPYKFDLSVFNQIHEPELVNHINRAGKSFYLRS